jgi:hypothetical protein
LTYFFSNDRISGSVIRITLLVLAFFTLWHGSGAVAQTNGAGTAVSPIGTTDFHYNTLQTTKYGPAAADIIVEPENFLSCKPPGAQKSAAKDFAYALCYYSGPAVATGNSGNPTLPCTLSADGKSANCICYKMTAAQYPGDPYLVDINAILNRDVYLATVKACGHDGKNCGRTSATVAPACKAVDHGTMMPKGSLVSVFSTKMSDNYSSTKGTTSCTQAKYAGCMTAPCHDTGKTDSAGTPLVSCQCPIYDGPFELGQANMPCDANALTPASTGSASSATYVWSSGHQASPKSQ